MFDAETSCLPGYLVLHVDVSDDKKWLCNEISYSRACSRER